MSATYDEGEARLPIEEQLSLKPRRFIEAKSPELAVKVRVEKFEDITPLSDSVPAYLTF